jgi:hypothetical protein
MLLFHLALMPAEAAQAVTGSWKADRASRRKPRVRLASTSKEPTPA